MIELSQVSLLTPEQAATLYRDGQTVAQVSVRANLSIASAAKLIRAGGGEIRRGYKAGQMTPEERTAKWTCLYREEKYTLQRIGEQFNVSRERVRQVLNKAGVPTSGHREEIDPDTATKIITLAASEPSLMSLAENVNLPLKIVLRALNDAGIKFKRKPSPMVGEELVRATRIAKMYIEGVSTTEIAEQFKIPHAAAVYRILDRMGLSWRHSDGVPYSSDSIFTPKARTRKDRRLRVESRITSDAAVVLYNQGRSIDEIAEIAGISKQRTSALLRSSNGAFKRRYKSRNPQRTQEWIALYTEDKILPLEIARRYDVKVENVKSVLMKSKVLTKADKRVDV